MVYDSPHKPYFKECSHGFRKSRNCHSALKEIQGKWSGTVWLIEGDIQHCFDDINHNILITIIRKKIKDERFINLIWKFLKAGYQELHQARKDSLAGTLQGGILSPILTNIYLHELDVYVEQLCMELEKGKLRRFNPAYRSLQKRRQYLGNTGRIKTAQYRKLGVQMRKLPSLDPKDPNFVRVRYVRYADDWLIGVVGPKRLAQDIRERVRHFLQSSLRLTLNDEKTVITHARTSYATFLGYRISLGRSKYAEQKQTLSTGRHKKVFKRRSTGMQVVLKAPMQELVRRLFQKGFCDKDGRPVHKAAWTLLDEDQIVRLYSSINRGIQQYYRPADNWAKLSRVQYILKFSLAKTLAAKRRVSITRVIKSKGIQVMVQRNGQRHTLSFYQNSDWAVDRKAFFGSALIDFVRMNVRMRTRSNLGLPCCICFERSGVAMHHVRHIRKLSKKQADGSNGLLAKLQRRQIPVCQVCHRKIHDGTYSAMKLSELAYDPRRPMLASFVADRAFDEAAST